MKNILLLCVALLSINFISCKKAEGEKASVGAAAEVEEATGVGFPVDIASSNIEWEGAKPTGSHTGTISLSDGEVVVSGGKVTGGSFTIDMNSINVTDLEGDSKAGLEGHLKGLAEGKEDHFFNTPEFPTGKFEITKVTNLDQDEEATHLVYGNLTLKGVSKEVGFKSNIEVTPNSVSVTTPPFIIDRTLWGVNYGSKTIFSDLGDKFVNDEIGLTINLNAAKSAI